MVHLHPIVASYVKTFFTLVVMSFAVLSSTGSTNCEGRYLQQKLLLCKM